MGRIYLSVPHMGTEEERFVHEAFESNWLSSVGPHLTAFEEEFTAKMGLPAVALASGTAAIHLALRLLDVGAGDEVLCPSLTFSASANPIIYQNATPVFIDSERRSWNMDPQIIADVITKKAAAGKKPKAVIVVHLYGQCADMDPIVEVCQKYEVPILEDAAEAVGTLYKGKPAGTFGEVSAYSFNGNKIITTTSGGMLVAKNPTWVEKARFWSTQSREPGIAYNHSELGFNYRMSNVLAGIGRGQLRVLDSRVAARRAVAFRYRDAFADTPGIELMPQADYGFHTNWLSCFLVDEKKLGVSRDAIIEALAKEDIESRPVWKPMHMQKFFGHYEMHGGAVAEDLFARGICLPSSSSLAEEDQARVIDRIRALAKRDSSASTSALHA